MIYANSYPVLLLNADFSPISIFPLKTLTWQEAIRGLFLDKLIRVAEYDAEVKSVSTAVRLPSVVALKQYKKVPHCVAFSRNNIWLRDHGRCVYCKNDLTTAELTFDHVMPRSRGGDTSWENIVCSCTACNLRKANRTPKESGMFPDPAPRKPNQFELARNAKRLIKSSPAPKDWIDFLYWDAELEN